MKKKIKLLILWAALTVLAGVGIVIFNKNSYPLAGALAGALITIFFGKSWKAGEDFFDTTNWKVSQTKLKRGGFIKDDTIIRISFAYLYRIKVGEKYLLVQNKRNTGKYQPVGGVYKLQGNEKQELKNLFHIMDDNKISIDELSRDDYRLRIENKYLRKFVKRFNNNNSSRERIDNLGREFKEELLETGVLDWDKITYRYCGRYMTELRFVEHFQDYEIQLFDVVELISTPEQDQVLEKLIEQERKKGLYRFATADQIISLGVDVPSGELNEWIGDHTKTIIQENETKLMTVPGVGNTYDVEFAERIKR